MKLSTYRWTELVLAIISIIFGLAIVVPGDLASRASSFVGLISYFPRFMWGILFTFPGIILVLGKTKFISIGFRRQMCGLLAVVWGLATFSFVLNGVRILGVILYAAVVLILIGHFLFPPPTPEGI